MDKIHKILKSYSKKSIPILDSILPIKGYTPLNLSYSNEKLNNIDIVDYAVCQQYIDGELKNNNALIAYGGYLEKRPLYSDKPEFTADGITRNIHLGMDFWTKAGTMVLAPIDGEIHSFQNNATFGDYGPTIVLQHKLKDITFYTLYGHLSLESLKELYVGRKFKKGKLLAALGNPDINVGYAPHLHFQIIQDMEGYLGTYPGVCSEQDLEFYVKNCPDPNLLLKVNL